jgi:hypothetical protein
MQLSAKIKDYRHEESKSLPVQTEEQGMKQV